jgi:hypothetical protein
VRNSRESAIFLLLARKKEGRSLSRFKLSNLQDPIQLSQFLFRLLEEEHSFYGLWGMMGMGSFKKLTIQTSIALMISLPSMGMLSGCEFGGGGNGEMSSANATSESPPTTHPDSTETMIPPVQEEEPGNKREETFFLNVRLGWKAEYRFYGMFREDMTLYRTTDGGETWAEIAGSDHPGSTLPGGVKSGIAFSSEKRGWITTNAPWQGKIGLYSSGDGGSTWQEQPMVVPAKFAEAQLYVYPPLFVTANEGVLVTMPESNSSLIYVTDDGGQTWTPVVDQNEGSLSGIAWTLSDDGIYSVVKETTTWTLDTSGVGPRRWLRLTAADPMIDQQLGEKP